MKWDEGFNNCCGIKPIVKEFDPLITSAYFVYCKKCGRKLESDYLVDMRRRWNEHDIEPAKKKLMADYYDIPNQ